MKTPIRTRENRTAGQEDQLLMTASPGTILGTDQDGVAVTLRGNQHLLIAGNAGCGKSAFAAALVAARLDAGAQVYVIGMERALCDFAPFTHQLAGISTTPGFACSVVDRVRSIVDDRLAATAETAWTPVLLVIDEADILLDKSDLVTGSSASDIESLRAAISDLIAEAHKVSVQVVVATQNPSSRTGIPPAAAFNGRICLGPATGPGRMVLFGSARTPEVTGRHDAVIQIGDEEPRRFDLDNHRRNR